MTRSSPIIAFCLIACVIPTTSATPTAPTKQRQSVNKSTKKRKAVPPPQPQPQPVAQTPPPPLTPEQMPPLPPQVSYLNGQLTIIAQNSTLTDVLSAVRRRTGAVIEIPGGAENERVAGRMGPGPARIVLAELLNGSKFDYVMIASAANPSGIEHVILTPRSSAPENGATNPTNVASNQPQQQMAPDQSEIPPPEGDETETPVAEEPPPQEEIPPDQQQQQGQPGAPQQFPQAQIPGGPVQQVPNGYPVPQGNPNAQQQGVKTPEQLLQEMQRMQQQQQQQQQPQQNPPQDQ